MAEYAGGDVEGMEASAAEEGRRSEAACMGVEAEAAPAPAWGEGEGKRSRGGLRMEAEAARAGQRQREIAWQLRSLLRMDTRCLV